MSATTVARALLFITLLGLTFACSPARAEWTLVTRGNDLGMRDGDKFYKLGMSADDFVKDFGPPEDRSDETLDYYGDGLRVKLDAGGRVQGFAIYLVPKTIFEKEFHAAANGQTDGGIGLGATYRQIAKAHGEPTSRKEYSDGTMYLNYPFGQITIENGGVSSLYVGKDEQAEVPAVPKQIDPPKAVPCEATASGKAAQGAVDRATLADQKATADAVATVHATDEYRAAQKEVDDDDATRQAATGQDRLDASKAWLAARAKLAQIEKDAVSHNAGVIAATSDLTSAKDALARDKAAYKPTTAPAD